MKRLTCRDEKTGNAYFPKYFKECNGHCRECEAETDYCETLAAYEDTGLTPDQIYEIDKLYYEKCKELADERKKNRWILTSEELPAEQKDGLHELDELNEYIVMILGAEMPTTLTYAGDGEWYDPVTQDFYPVIAWRPMPEPYKEGQQ